MSTKERAQFPAIRIGQLVLPLIAGAFAVLAKYKASLGYLALTGIALLGVVILFALGNAVVKGRLKFDGQIQVLVWAVVILAIISGVLAVFVGFQPYLFPKSEASTAPGAGSSKPPAPPTYELACDANKLQLVVDNRHDGARKVELYGVTLTTVYDAVYPKAAMQVGAVPSYAPLQVALGEWRVQQTRGPKLLEIAAQDSGLVEIPLELRPPTEHTLYMHAMRVCPRLSLAGEPPCLPAWLVIVDASDSQSHCNATTDAALDTQVKAALARFEPPADADALKLLIAIKPDDTATLIMRTFEHTEPAHIGLRLELLDAMSKLTDADSLSLLLRIEDDEHASTSERTRALSSRVLRDPMVDKLAVLRT
ncbi:MAG: hypothetical protein H7138_21780 [Myxococcales bacterium]|nr:hypothetical protein [Myxococcales bacterium]